MSSLYPDLENKFPEQVDNFEKFIDPDIASLQIINMYYQYFDAGQLTEANQLLTQNPQLKRMILNAESLNQVRDGLISVERYYLNDVQKYLMNIIQYKSDWNSGTRYSKYDVVSYQRVDVREVYMCIRFDTPIGTLPTDLNYWIPLVIRGEKGESGVGLAFQGAYSSSRQYYKNDAVQYLGSLYGALQDNIDIKPTVGGSDPIWALAWNFQIPDKYIQMPMLSDPIQTAINTAGNFMDDVTGGRYRWGASNGLVYIEQIG